MSAALQTDKFYDMLGSTAFIVLAIGTLTYGHYYHARQVVVTVMVLLWGLRLGSFLVLRVFKTGSDSRFDKVKRQPCKYPGHTLSICGRVNAGLLRISCGAVLAPA